MILTDFYFLTGTHSYNNLTTYPRYVTEASYTCLTSTVTSTRKKEMWLSRSHVDLSDEEYIIDFLRYTRERLLNTTPFIKKKTKKMVPCPFQRRVFHDVLP